VEINNLHKTFGSDFVEAPNYLKQLQNKVFHISMEKQFVPKPLSHIV
jgi:hypothetical protein